MNKELYNLILNKKHHKYRKEIEVTFDESLSAIERMTLRFETLAQAETPVLLEGEKICFLRTVKNIPNCFTEEEWSEIKLKQYIHGIRKCSKKINQSAM